MNIDTFSITASTSSTVKGETLADTARNIEAMMPDILIMRHPSSGAPHYLARYLNTSVINAGDGTHAHPTQGLLDLLTLRDHLGDLAGRRVLIVGDILHSRVARSQIHALTTLGVTEVRVIGPKTLIPDDTRSLGVHIYHDMWEGLRDADVIIMLRLQKERMSGALLPSEQEFYRLYGLTEDRLKHAKPDAIVMHPGPINRGVEMDSQVADGPRSVILQQVSHGIAVRMAVMSMAMTGQTTQRQLNQEAN